MGLACVDVVLRGLDGPVVLDLADWKVEAMNRENIIRMAREAAGGMLSYDGEGEWRLSEPEAIRFAELVRQHTQIEQMPKFEELAKILREECAKVCEEQRSMVVARHPARVEFDPDSAMALKCAAAIRSRGHDDGERK